MSEYHALLSPSGAAKWIACPNSLAAEDGQPDTGDAGARDLGTDKHELLALCLEFKQKAITYTGHVLKCGHTVNAAIAADVQVVVDGVDERVVAYQLSGATVCVELEQAVPISQITGEVGATGTADVVLIVTWPDGRGEICVIDAKFGYREVDPEMNPQLMMYALGAIEKFSQHTFQTASLMIAQPAISETFSEWQTTVAVLDEWSEQVGKAASKALIVYNMREQRPLLSENFNPGPKQCMWCNAKAVCPARADKVKEIIGADFDNIESAIAPDLLTNDDLGDIWSSLDFIESWAKAVRGRIEYELLQGNNVPGTKLVEGRRGTRGWDVDAEAESLLKSFRLKQEEMYSFKLLGPKPILEALKDQPRRLKKVEALITQKAGKPHVAHVSDKREALEVKPVADDFEAVEDNSDLV